MVMVLGKMDGGLFSTTRGGRRQAAGGGFVGDDGAPSGAAVVLDVFFLTSRRRAGGKFLAVEIEARDSLLWPRRHVCAVPACFCAQPPPAHI